MWLGLDVLEVGLVDVLVDVLVLVLGDVRLFLVSLPSWWCCVALRLLLVSLPSWWCIRALRLLDVSLPSWWCSRVLHVVDLWICCALWVCWRTVAATADSLAPPASFVPCDRVLAWR